VEHAITIAEKDAQTMQIEGLIHCSSRIVVLEALVAPG
jgi:hypothetical protein